MNAAAWIALAGAIVVVLTNVVVITRFISALESKLSIFRAEIEGNFKVIAVEHKGLVERANADLGRIRSDQQQFQRDVDDRLRDTEERLRRIEIGQRLVP